MNHDELLIAIKDMVKKKVDEVKQHTELLVEKSKIIKKASESWLFF